MCRPIKGADQQTNHVVLRTGKVLATTRAHLSYMELMVVLSFSGLRGVGHFVKRLLKRWFAQKSSNPKMPSVCVCVCMCVRVVVPTLLRPQTFSFHTRTSAHTQTSALCARPQPIAWRSPANKQRRVQLHTCRAPRLEPEPRVPAAQRQRRREKGAATTAQ